MNSFKHHVIPLHEWKSKINPKVTRWDKEFNAPDNVVRLTLEQHIQVHWLLWELNACEYDRVAYLSLSKQVGCAEAQRMASYAANRGHRHNLGRKHTKEARQQISMSLTGRKLSGDHKRNMAAVRIGRKRGFYNKKSCTL